MSKYTTHITDGIDLLVSPVTFGAGSGVTTLVGGTVAAYAKNSTTGAKVAATSCTIASATSIRATWAPGLLPVGSHNVQVYATPVAHAIQTVSDTEWTIKEAAGP
jgi:broad specificity polyphosphatase/5'/3'-nucleotidase SurE